MSLDVRCRRACAGIGAPAAPAAEHGPPRLRPPSYSPGAAGGRPRRIPKACRPSKAMLPTGRHSACILTTSRPSAQPFSMGRARSALPQPPDIPIPMTTATQGRRLFPLLPLLLALASPLWGQNSFRDLVGPVEVGPVASSGALQVPYITWGGRRGDLPRQRGAEHRLRIPLPRAGARPQPGSRRRLRGAGEGLSLGQEPLPAGDLPHDGHGLGGDRLRSPDQGGGRPAAHLVGRRPPGRPGEPQHHLRSRRQHVGPPAGRPARGDAGRHPQDRGAGMERHRGAVGLGSHRHRGLPRRDLPQRFLGGRLLRHLAGHVRPVHRHRQQGDRGGGNGARRPCAGIHRRAVPLHRRRVRGPQGLLRRQPGNDRQVRRRLPQGGRGGGLHDEELRGERLTPLRGPAAHRPEDLRRGGAHHRGRLRPAPGLRLRRVSRKRVLLHRRRKPEQLRGLPGIGPGAGGLPGLRQREDGALPLGHGLPEPAVPGLPGDDRDQAGGALPGRGGARRDRAARLGERAWTTRPSSPSPSASIPTRPPSARFSTGRSSSG